MRALSQHEYEKRQQKRLADATKRYQRAPVARKTLFHKELPIAFEAWESTRRFHNDHNAKAEQALAKATPKQIAAFEQDCRWERADSFKRWLDRQQEDAIADTLASEFGITDYSSRYHLQSLSGEVLSRLCIDGRPIIFPTATKKPTRKPKGKKRTKKRGK